MDRDKQIYVSEEISYIVLKAAAAVHEISSLSLFSSKLNQMRHVTCWEHSLSGTIFLAERWHLMIKK